MYDDDFNAITNTVALLILSSTGVSKHIGLYTRLII